MPENLLFIQRKQFGYQTDYLYYADFLKTKYNVSFLSPDTGHEKSNAGNLNTIYFPFPGSGAMAKILRNLRFYVYIWNYLKKHPVDMIFWGGQFPFAFIFRLGFINIHQLYDIRSGAVNINPIRRFFKNTRIKFDCLFFKYLSILSGNLARKLQLPESKTTILPLGGYELCEGDKNFKFCRLIYLGTLSNRNIDHSIEGLGKYYTSSQEKKIISYDIIGKGSIKEIEKIKNAISKYNLEDIVKYHGYLPLPEVKDLFRSGNVGVVYVPQTKYYQFQPPTKLFEYLVSGMPVIATSTYENSLVVNEKNGILINDDPDSFYRGLIELERRCEHYNSSEIKEISKVYHWDYINENILDPLIKKILYQN